MKGSVMLMSFPLVMMITVMFLKFLLLKFLLPNMSFGVRWAKCMRDISSAV